MAKHCSTASSANKEADSQNDKKRKGRKHEKESTCTGKSNFYTLESATQLLQLLTFINNKTVIKSNNLVEKIHTTFKQSVWFRLTQKPGSSYLNLLGFLLGLAQEEVPSRIVPGMKFTYIFCIRYIVDTFSSTCQESSESFS